MFYLIINNYIGNADLAQKLALARQEILELKTTIRNLRRTMIIPSDRLGPLDEINVKKLSQEIKDNDIDNVKGKIPITIRKKVSPDVDEVDSRNRSKNDKSSEKKKKRNPEQHEESIERLSNNSFSPENIFVGKDLKFNQDKKEKRRKSFSGTNSYSDLNSNNQENIFNIHGDDNNTIVKNSNANVNKRRSSMSSLQTSISNIRQSLSPSRRPLRLRQHAIDYKEPSLTQKMRSSFYIIKKQNT